MIRRSEEKISIRKPSPFNGVGEITVRNLLNGPEEMGRMSDFQFTVKINKAADSGIKE